MTAVVGGLPAFRERLVSSRDRLVERIIDEDDPGRALPDTAWIRMAADLHSLILAVGDMIRANKDTRYDNRK